MKHIHPGKYSCTTRILFLGKNKEICSKGLEYLVKRGFTIARVVIPENFQGGSLEKTAKKLGLLTTGSKELDKEISEGTLKPVDYVISLLYWKRMKMPLLQLATKGTINFHPAPLPEYRGAKGYNIAIYEQEKEYGVSAHWVDNEELDSGDIIKVNKFPINEDDTAFSLEQRTQVEMFELFKNVMEKIRMREQLPRIRNVSLNGHPYLSKEQLEYLKEVKLEEIEYAHDTIELERKCKAFWYPPYTGAYINIKGKKFTLVPTELLSKEIREKYDEKRKKM